MMTKIKKCYSIFLPIITFVIIFGFIMSYFFDVYEVEGPSMENTMFHKNRIVVLKLYKPKNPGYYKNKLLVVHSSSNNIVIKRCVGIAGDTICMVNAHVFVNGHLYQEPLTVKKSWKIYSNEKDHLKDLHGKSISSGFAKKDSFHLLNASIRQIQFLSDAKLIDSIVPYCNNLNIELWCFDKSLKWDIDNFGEYIVPYPGFISSENELLKTHYCNLISKFQSRDEQKFNENYLFLLGDNRLNSMDSRFFGAVPVSLVIGVPVLLLNCGENGKRKFVSRIN